MTTNTEGAVTGVAAIAAKLTEAQRTVLLAIRPGEQRRAIDFSGSVARNLCRSNKTRPALLWGTLTASGQVAWFGHSPAGLAVRNHLTEQGVTAS